jgi:site-specific recombinase XerD
MKRAHLACTFSDEKDSTGSTIICAMATVKLVLDKRRKKKSGAYPLVIRIRHLGKYFDVTTNQDLHEHQFDDKRELVVRNKSLNRYLQRQIDNCIDKLIHLEQQHDEVTIDQIKALFGKTQKSEPTIEEFWHKEAMRLTEIGKAGNAGVYLSSLRGLNRVMNLDIPFKELKHKQLLDAETSLLKNGVKLNTLSVYMRTLRAICNKAILVDLVDQSWYPFFRYKIKKGKSVPRTLNLEQMKRYFELDLPEQHPLYRSFCIGKLMFLLRGINFKDLVKLTNENLQVDRIVYERSKTKTIYSIGIEEEIKEHLRNLFKGGKTLVGVMDDEFHLLDQDMKVLRRYEQHLHVLNNHLKKIGKLLEFELNLSTYVMRYSYANIARSLGISVEEISYLLGHKSTAHAVTEIYLEQFDLQKLDALNKKIINAVTGR